MFAGNVMQKQDPNLRFELAILSFVFRFCSLSRTGKSCINVCKLRGFCFFEFLHVQKEHRQTVYGTEPGGVHDCLLKVDTKINGFGTCNVLVPTSATLITSKHY